jgi:hypothetical protein
MVEIFLNIGSVDKSTGRAALATPDVGENLSINIFASFFKINFFLFTNT